MGQPALVLVSGEAGVGKTRLVSESLVGLNDEDVLVTGGAVDLMGGEIPMVLLASSLRGLVQRYGLDTVRGWAGQDVSRLAVLVRDLVPESSVAHDPIEVIDAFRAMVSRLSGTRFVWWAVEDLQWADDLSRDAVRFVVQLMQSPERLLVTCTLRTKDRAETGVAGSFVSELVRAPATERIRLGPLDVDQVRAQVASLRGEPVSSALADRVMFLSDGIPFLVEELVAAGLTETGPVPASASELMLSRLASFGADAGSVVGASAVARGHLQDRWLALVTGLSPTRLEEALTLLVDGGVLDVDDSFAGYRFHHGLMREGVAETMLPGERRRWHRAWAEALSTSNADEHDFSTMVEIAQHWIHAGVPDRAFMSAITAARAAERVGAQAERAVMLCEALRLWSQVDSTVGADHHRDDLVEQAIWACALGGRAELGIEMLAAQMRSPDPSGDRELRRLRLSLARDRFLRDLGSEPAVAGPSLLGEQVALLRRSPRSLLFAHAVSELVSNSNDVASSRLLDDLSIDAIEVATQMGTDFDQVDLKDSRSHHLKVLGRLDEAVTLELEVLRDYGSKLPLADLMRVESNTVSMHFQIGRFADGAEIGRHSVSRLSDPRLCPGPWSSLAENLAATLIETGDWSEAEGHLDAVESLGATTPAAYMALLNAALLECRRGNLTAA
jgi:hypothetical protein